jgi:hypothetical protein
MDWKERENALRVLFTAPDKIDPLDEQGIAHWARSLVLHVQDACAKRAEFGDFVTGQGCRDGYRHDGEIGRARKKAADDIRKLRWGPDYNGGP